MASSAVALGRPVWGKKLKAYVGRGSLILHVYGAVEAFLGSIDLNEDKKYNVTYSQV